MSIDLVDYEAHYRRGERLFGAPNRQFVRFLAARARRRTTVLDLGCGQGRDALAAARLGHQVVGVDLSPTGIRQMLEDARAEGLQVAGVVADVIGFRIAAQVRGRHAGSRAAPAAGRRCPHLLLAAHGRADQGGRFCPGRGQCPLPRAGSPALRRSWQPVAGAAAHRRLRVRATHGLNRADRIMASAGSVAR